MMVEIVTLTGAIEFVLGEGVREGIRHLLRGRLETARDVFFEESRSGITAGNVPPDEFVSVALRYLRAAEEGTAKRNLRLMAQVMVRNVPQAPSLYADEFLRWADVLATLRREECIAVATLYRLMQEEFAGGAAPENLAGAATLKTTIALAQGDAFADEADVSQALSSATRTGLVQPHSGWGMLVYSTTPLMDKLATIVRLEDMERGEV